MTLKRINQLWGCILLCAFIYLAVLARTTLKYWMNDTVIGPGPGYFPFWISSILAGITLYWLVQVTIKPGEAMPENFVPSRIVRIKIAVIFGDLILFTLFAQLLGFFLMTSIFIFIILIVLGNHGLRARISYALFSLAGSFFFTYVFGDLLDVDFPKSSIGVLKAMGL